MRRLISDPQQLDAQYLIGTIAKYVSQYIQTLLINGKNTVNTSNH